MFGCSGRCTVSRSPIRMQRLKPFTLARHQGCRMMAVTAKKAQKSADSLEPSSITTKEMYEAVSNEINISPKDVKMVVESFLSVISQTVATGKKVTLTGFGQFKRIETAERLGRNPRTGEELQIAASARPSFTAGKSFKDLVKDTYNRVDKRLSK